MKYLIAGLGNIGAEYASTRHNIGFMVLDALAAKHSLKFELAKYGYIARWHFKSRYIILLKPTTYMNKSGEAVRYWLQQEKIDVENLLVVADELSFELGNFKLKPKGSSGGHNGFFDVEQKIQTQQYARLRVGIGNNFSKGRQVEYVLGKFTENELIVVDQVVEKCVEVIENFCTIGLERTMNLANSK